MGLWGLVIALLEDGSHGVAIDEGVLVARGTDASRRDRRKLQKALKERQPAFTRRLLARVARRLRRQGLAVELVITDTDKTYPGILREVFPGARHQVCLFHVLRNIGRAFEREFGRKRSVWPEGVGALKDLLAGIGSALSMAEVTATIDRASDRARSLGLNRRGAVSRIIRSLRKRSGAIFRFLVEGTPCTNNGMEQVFARVDPLYKVAKSFQSRSGMANFLSCAALFLDACPFIDGRNKGVSPLQMAGLDAPYRRGHEVPGGPLGRIF
jgi:hypothetical protein